MVSARPWGWHQLKRQWAEDLVERAGVGTGDLVLDVGAGTGAITAPLIATGARVIAFELNAHRAQQLRERFGKRLVVVEVDASDLRLPRRPFHVVANPPFGITTALLRRLLHPGSRLLSARLVLQEQAARRWASGTAPGAARSRGVFALEVGTRMPRHAFLPPPRTNALVLTVTRRP